MAEYKDLLQARHVVIMSLVIMSLRIFVFILKQKTPDKR